MSTHPKSNEVNTPPILRLGPWISIWAHILSGVFTLFLIFPFISTKAKKARVQRWSVRLLKIFGIKLVVKNSNILPNHSYLLSSNHISWMDIHAINAFKPIRFVAKSEVEKWPIFGWMATQLGTVFIKRDSSRHAHFVVGKVSEVLKTQSICIFPEGTSTDGKSVRPFKPNLFEAAVTADVPVYTLAIRYLSGVSGQWSDVPAFIGEMTLLESIGKILKNRNLIVELSFFPPPGSTPQQPGDRKWLALHSYEQISKYLGATNSL